MYNNAYYTVVSKIYRVPPEYYYYYCYNIRHVSSIHSIVISTILLDRKGIFPSAETLQTNANDGNGDDDDDERKKRTIKILTHAHTDIHQFDCCCCCFRFNSLSLSLIYLYFLFHLSQKRHSIVIRTQMSNIRRQQKQFNGINVYVCHGIIHTLNFILD